MDFRVPVYRYRTYKIYIFLIRINSRVDLALVCLSVRINVEILGTIKARGMILSIQILET